MNNFESSQPSSLESASEQAFSRDKILSIIEQRLENFTIKRELHDTNGLYLLEVQSVPNSEGEVTQYEFMRQGRHEGHNQASQSAIRVIYLRDDIPLPGGGLRTLYDTSKNAWEEVK
jgi:hypothetical protein